MFQLLVPYQFWEMVDNENISSYLLKIIQDLKDL